MTVSIKETAEAVVQKDNPLREYLEGCFGKDLSGLEDEQVCVAVQVIFACRMYFLRMSACEIRDSLREVLADFEPSAPAEATRLARHLASLESLVRRLEELGEWTEKEMAELCPNEPWSAEVIAEDFLFDTN